jgi:hypothetical protein
LCIEGQFYQPLNFIVLNLIQINVSFTGFTRKSFILTADTQAKSIFD